jgi:hypothetical protein
MTGIQEEGGDGVEKFLILRHGGRQRKSLGSNIPGATDFILTQGKLADERIVSCGGDRFTGLCSVEIPAQG